MEWQKVAKDSKMNTLRQEALAAQSLALARLYCDNGDWRGAVMWAEDACQRFARNPRWLIAFDVLKTASNELERELKAESKPVRILRFP